MMFVLGFMAGMTFSVVFFLGIVFLRIPLERQVRKTERYIAKKAPRARGFIIDAVDDATRARNEILERNRELGKDTPLSELYENS